MQRFWCGVVSREHIKRGEAGGFCQVCHGKRAPLARMAVGDGIVFYSPVEQFKGTEKCQKFTAIGQVSGAETYQFEMFPGFIPFRRDVNYFDCQETRIHPLLDELEFTRGQTSWGNKFRFGHFEVSQADFLLIAQQMLPTQWQQHFGSNLSGNDMPGTAELAPAPRKRASKPQRDLFADDNEAAAISSI